MAAGARNRHRQRHVGCDLNTFSEFIVRLGLARIAAMAIVAVLMLGFFAFLIMRASSPQLAPLYSGIGHQHLDYLPRVRACFQLLEDQSLVR